jgi:hypothetical protein
MLNSPEHAEAGARFFRREYPRLVADRHRLLPLLRAYYADGGRPAAGVSGLDEYLQRMTAEIDTLRRTVRAKLLENKRLRRLVGEAPSRNPVTA